MNLLTAPQVWADYNAEDYDLDVKLIYDSKDKQTFSYVANKVIDGDIVVQIDVYKPAFDSNKILLLVGEYQKNVQKEVIRDLTERGYVVCVPDYSAILPETKTFFPPSVEYGYCSKAGDHIKKVSPTAKDTSQYLYSVNLRRAISFIVDYIGKKEIIVIGFGVGVEVAMQAVAQDKRPIGLVCINGASYLEYVNYQKYGTEKEMQIDDELMLWLTGVSSIAYAKHINIPVLFALGSNGTLSDIDRLANIYNLLASDDVRLVISPRYTDNIDKKAYNTVLAWLESRFVYSTLPENPTVSVSVNKEGVIYADVKIDSIIKIEEVKVYYSYGDYNHATRYWEVVSGEAVAVDNYIAKLEVSEADIPLFAFAEVKYRNNITLSSLPYYQNLSSHKVKSSRYKLNPIVFQYSTGEGDFTEISKDAVVLESSLSQTVIPIGLKGLECKQGGMVSFAIGAKKNITQDKLLQIDTFSEQGKYDLSITLITGGEVSNEYTATKHIEVDTDTFSSERFVAHDFKDSNFKPLENWSLVKGIRINNSNVIVGKIMFV
ncbi:MAG: hypothetical protein GX242_05510 [Clostridiales bacterium]|nr:hypothetical protein [Clostridiales bacterium]